MNPHNLKNLSFISDQTEPSPTKFQKTGISRRANFFKENRCRLVMALLSALKIKNKIKKKSRPILRVKPALANVAGNAYAPRRRPGRKTRYLSPKSFDGRTSGIAALSTDLESAPLNLRPVHWRISRLSLKTGASRFSRPSRKRPPPNIFPSFRQG